MAEGRFADGLRTIATLLVPAAIGATGIYYSARQNASEHVLQSQQQIFDRDIVYAKFLMGTPQERSYALRTVKILVQEKQFDEAQAKLFDETQVEQFDETLLPAVVELASGPASDPETQQAKEILKIAASKSKEVSKRIEDARPASLGGSVSPAPPALPNLSFFLRQSEQASAYAKCAGLLRSDGYQTESVLVDHGPNHNSVRHFNQDDDGGAGKLVSALSKCVREPSYKYDLSDDPESKGTPAGTFEVWFGATEVKLVDAP